MPHLTGKCLVLLVIFHLKCLILRIGGVTSTKTIFINDCLTLVSRMINKEGNVNTISKTLSKRFSRYIQTFSKLFAKSLEFVEPICTKINYIWLFWLGQIMSYPLGFNPM